MNHLPASLREKDLKVVFWGVMGSHQAYSFTIKYKITARIQFLKTGKKTKEAGSLLTIVLKLCRE